MWRLKSKGNIFIAFVLNLIFAVIELFGGLLTGSITILSDAMHDLGDAVSLAVCSALEKKSKKMPDESFTYGYLRYSVLGAVITNTILIIGSVAIVYSAVCRLFTPTQVDASGMVVFAVLGVLANSVAVIFTGGGSSLNQKAVSLHLAEDVLGWAAILLGSILIKYTGITVIDSVMSFAVAAFVLFNAARSFKRILDIFLEKVPDDISVSAIKETALSDAEVIDVHHIHLRSLDGVSHSATMHVVTETGDPRALKCRLKLAFMRIGIAHTTLEFESYEELMGESGETERMLDFCD